MKIWLHCFHTTRVIWPDGKTEEMAYSSCCPRIIDQYTDRAGRTSSFAYNNLEWRTESRHPDGSLHTYLYDADGRMTDFLDPHQVRTRFTYDADGFLTEKTYANGDAEAFVYNPQGRISKKTNSRGISATYTYDKNGNLTQIAYSDATPNVTLTWDATDRLTRIVDGAGTWNYTYTADSKVHTVDGPWDNDTLTYTYDGLGRVVTLAVENGETQTWTYDIMNRPVTVRTGGNAFTYAYTAPASSLIKKLNRPSGAATTYAYDGLQRLTGISHPHGMAGTYTYNDQDLRASETLTGGLSAPAVQEGMIQRSFNDVDQMLSEGDREFVYDKDGNLVQGYTKDGFVFTATYDAENRLSTISYTDNENALHKTVYTYRYDSFLVKIAKYKDNALTEETRIVRAGFLELQDRDQNNAVIREYTWGLNLGGGIGGLVNICQNGENFHPLYDGKGNIIALLDSTGAVAAQYRYDTFGRLTAKTGTLDQPFGFSTKRTDSDLGLVYYGYRFYNPDLERWMSRDPLGEEGGINLYGFVGNDPVNWVDLWGLKPGDKFPTMDAAAIDAINYINPRSIRENIEYGGYFYKDENGMFSYTEPIGGDGRSVYTEPTAAQYGEYHTHGACDPDYKNENFSKQDIIVGHTHNHPSYLGTPSGAIKKFDPKDTIITKEGKVIVKVITLRPSINKTDCSKSPGNNRKRKKEKYS